MFSRGPQVFRLAKAARLARPLTSGNAPRNAMAMAMAMTRATPKETGVHAVHKLVAGGLMVAALALVQSQAENQSRDSKFAVKAEELYNSPAVDRRELLTHLQRVAEDNPRDVGVLWRLARASYDVASLTTNVEEKKALTYAARDVIQKALDLEDDNFAVHKWFGIILSSVGEFEGSKATIANSYIVRDHWLRAIELNPSDATSHNLLGRWCLTIADISWIERKLAAAIFGTPPQSSYAEALEYFLKADSISPGFWKKNTLLIAQTYLKLNDVEQAKAYTLQALAIATTTEEDKQVHQEAEALRAKLKI